MPEYMYDRDGRPVLIDWSESGWVGFEVLWWLFYIVVIIPIRLVIDLLKGRRR